MNALEKPGDVVLDLDAAGLSDGALAAWSGNSTQTLMQATASARPTVGTIKGVKAVTFDGNDWLDIAGVDFRLIGSTAPFTVETYIYNPTIEAEESYFCWAPRGNSGATWDGKCRSLSYGSHTGYGAVGFWKSNWEMGFSSIPTAAAWHHIVTTYDGTTLNVYVDGFLNASKSMTPNATTNLVYSIGRASSQDGTNIKWFSGSIARLRICTGALSAQQVYRNAAYLKHVLASGADTVIANAYGNSAYSSITDISGNGDYTTASIQLTDGASLTIATNTVAGQIGVMNNAALTVNDSHRDPRFACSAIRCHAGVEICRQPIHPDSRHGRSCPTRPVYARPLGQHRKSWSRNHADGVQRHLDATHRRSRCEHHRRHAIGNESHCPCQ